MNSINTAIAKSDGELFLTHMHKVLSVFNSICTTYTDLPQLIGVQEFYEHLFLALFFHDVGKLGSSFQKDMRNYSYRHEIISTSVMNEILLDDSYKRTVMLAVIMHHKDIDEIKKYSTSSEEGKALFETKLVEFADNYEIFIEYVGLLKEFGIK